MAREGVTEFWGVIVSQYIDLCVMNEQSLHASVRSYLGRRRSSFLHFDNCHGSSLWLWHVNGQNNGGNDKGVGEIILGKKIGINYLQHIESNESKRYGIRENSEFENNLHQR